MFDLTYEMKVVFIILVVLLGLYLIKDKIFPPKQVTFDPVVIEKEVDEDSDNFIPSETFTGRKTGFVFTLGDRGQGYYRDEIEMEKLKY
jgi:hypothetical protein